MTGPSRPALVVASVLAACAPTALQGQPMDMAAARAEVLAANEAELAAIIEGDARRAASMFVEDAVLLPPDGSLVEGRSAIEAFWAPTPGLRIERVDTEVSRFDADGRHAYLVGRYELESEQAGESTVTRGRFFMVWRRTPEGWRIVIDMWN